VKNKGILTMKIRNILKGGVVLGGLVAFVSAAMPASAATLQPPDSDALVAGYQIIQFNLKECTALSPRAGISNNGAFIVSPAIRKIAAQMCSESREYSPKLEALAKSKDFELPKSLPYYLNARWAALVRNQNGNLGQQYLEDQISSHEDALAVFQEEAATGQDPHVKAAATEIIPTVQANLDQLKKLAGNQ
jgi:putative membrane protein